MVCGIDNYNQDKGKFSPNGVFNAMLIPSASVDGLNAYTTTEQVLGQNLYFRANGSSFGYFKNTPLNAVLRMSTIRDLSSDLPITANVYLSTINFNSEQLYYTYANNPLAILTQVYSTGSLLMSQAPPDLIAIYLLQVLQYFNWDLFGAIFSSDIIGFLGQNSIQNILSAFRLNNGIRLPCSAVLDDKLGSAYQPNLNDFASCITSQQTIRVIIVWMQANDCIYTTQQLLKILGTDKGFVFLYPGLPYGVQFTPDVVGSMFLNPFSSDNQRNITCSQNARDQLIKIYGAEIVDSVSKHYGNCTLSDPTLPFCKDDLLRANTAACQCTSENPLYSPYAADSLDLLMKSIESMQTNCSFLNYCVSNLYPEFKVDYCKNTKFDGPDLYYAAKCSPFYGNTGLVAFLNSSNLRESFLMQLLQLQPNRKVERVGVFANGTMTLYGNFYFQGGQPPVSTIEINDPSLSDGFVVAFFIIDIILMVIKLALVVFVLLKRKNLIIRRSGLSSNLLVLLGLFSIEISVIFMCFYLSRTLCVLVDVFMLIGVSFIISTLAAKLYRIYRIFQNPTAQAIRITDKDLFIFTCVITLGTIIIFVLYDALGGGLQPIPKVATLNFMYEYYICEVPNSAIQTTFLILFYVYFLLLFVAAGVLAFMTRKTSRDYNESIHVSSVVYSWLAVAIIYAPIYYVQGSSTDSNETRYAVRFIAITIVIILTLGILFWNKVHGVLKLERRRKR